MFVSFSVILKDASELFINCFSDKFMSFVQTQKKLKLFEIQSYITNIISNYETFVQIQERSPIEIGARNWL